MCSLVTTASGKQRFTHDRSGNHTLFIIFVGINGTTIPRCCGHRRSSSLPVPPANEETKSRKGKENGDNQNGKEQEGINIYRKAFETKFFKDEHVIATMLALIYSFFGEKFLAGRNFCVEG